MAPPGALDRRRRFGGSRSVPPRKRKRVSSRDEGSERSPRTGRSGGEKPSRLDRGTSPTNANEEGRRRGRRKDVAHGCQDGDRKGREPDHHRGDGGARQTGRRF